MAIRSQDQNLDSLLDTMANVVGILVVLVAVTQISVGNAIDRISGQSDLDLEVAPADLALARTRADEIEAAIVVAEGRLDALEPTARRRGLLLEEARPHVEALEAMEGRYELGGESVPELRSRVRRESEAVAQIAAVVSAESKRLSRLDALISDVPTETRPKIARLPDPRPPPASARGGQLAFFCRYGRVAALDLKGMRAMLERGIRDALGDDRAIAYEDRPWLVNLFSKTSFGSGNFFWSFREDAGRAFFADVKWRDQSFGETLIDLRSGHSKLAEEFGATSQSGHFLRFYVWSDSFEVYLEARYIAEAMGWNVSWLAVDEHSEVGMNLLGGSQQPILLD